MVALFLGKVNYIKYLDSEHRENQATQLKRKGQKKRDFFPPSFLGEILKKLPFLGVKLEG